MNDAAYSASAMAICKGNLGSARVCNELRAVGATSLLPVFEACSTTGCEPWLLYKDICGEDIRSLVFLLMVIREERVAARDVVAAANERDAATIGEIRATIKDFIAQWYYAYRPPTESS